MRRWWNSYADLTPFTAFCWLWAAGTLFHATDRFAVEFLGDQVAVALFALLFFLTPNLHALVFMLLTQAFVAALKFPMIENHMVLVLAVDALLLCKLLPAFLWKTDVREDDAWRSVVPTLRWLAILLYACALFHKLNTGFLDPVSSCAVTFYNDARTEQFWLPLPALGDMGARVLIGATLLAEALIPLLLLWRRGWFWGIALGVLFHVFASQVMRDFPLFAMALYVAFIPEDVLKKTFVHLRPKPFAMAAAACAVIGIAGSLVPGWEGLRTLSFRLWNIAVLLTFAWLCVFVFRNRLHAVPAERREARPWHAILPVLFVVNCMLPYAGLRTIGTLSMFSNLRTEAGTENHLFMPRIGPAAFQDDLVEIVETNDPMLRSDYPNEYRAAWSSLRQHARHRAENRQPFSLTYVRAGETVTLPDATKDAALTAAGSWWEKFTLGFRAVPPGAAAPCQW